MTDAHADIVQIRQGESRQKATCCMWWANVTISVDDGPEVTWGGCDPEALTVMAKALTDYVRAVRAGDDPDEIVRVEWRRRRASRAAEAARRAGADLAYGLADPAGIPPGAATGA